MAKTMNGTRKLNQKKKSKKLKKKCQICNHSFDATSLILQHVVAKHFFSEIKENATDLYQGTNCLICDKGFSTEVYLVLHIGVKHKKVNDVLLQKGLKPVDASVTVEKPRKIVNADVQLDFEADSENIVDENIENSGRDVEDNSDLLMEDKEQQA